MELKIKWNQNCTTLNVYYTESDVWKAVAQTIANIPIPNDVEVEINDQKAYLKLMSRGKVAQADGSTKPSLFVTCSVNNINLLPDRYPECYLTCINLYGNNYKFYRIISDGSDTLKCEYGRIGTQAGEMFAPKTTTHPSYMYWIRYYEKLSKGYQDQTKVFLSQKVEKKVVEKSNKHEQQKVDSNTARDVLYNLLVKYAKKTVEETLIEPAAVTIKQVKLARSKLKRIMSLSGKRNSNVKKFNDALLELMVVTPRRVTCVEDFMAKSTEDFAVICDREEALVNAMDVVANNNEVKQETTASFRSYIDVTYPDESQEIQIKQLFSDEMRPNIKKIFMVDSKEQDTAFDRYCEQNEITNKKLLMHGSRNENWYSITENGLKLPQHNNATKTGWGLGKGIYFGNHSQKCSHYTFGNYRDDIVIGVFETAYGNPQKVLDNDHNQYRNHSQSELDKNHKNCIHYHRKGTDWADEIVFYKENSSRIKALVVLNG